MRKESPYTLLGCAIVEQAIQDYIIWLNRKDKDTANMSRFQLQYHRLCKFDGKSAERFLVSKMSNFLGGIDNEINIRAEVEKRYKTIDEEYDFEKEKYLNEHSQKVFRPYRSITKGFNK